MEFGCHLPVFGPAAQRATVLGFARRMEALGFDALWVSDHVVLPRRMAPRYPYSPSGEFPLSPDTAFLEPLTTLAVVAGVTERIRLGTSVLVLPHRHPLLAAKMLATLDHLAGGGRVVAGVGVGWMAEEIELLGVPYAQRGAWSDEAIEVMRRCWTDAAPAFHGRFFRFEPLGFAPRPRAPIPIWVGGHTRAALRRAARLGDGWHAAFPSPPALERALAELRAACAAVGRDPASLTVSVRLGLPARKAADQILAELQALAALGVRHVVLETRVGDLDEMAAIYERFARDVRRRLDG
jgi:probable F420-dependent oxidoreductase